jgi:hypothetical protein
VVGSERPLHGRPHLITIIVHTFFLPTTISLLFSTAHIDIDIAVVFVVVIVAASTDGSGLAHGLSRPHVLSVNVTMRCTSSLPQSRANLCESSR